MSPYAYLDDWATADVAFRAWGATLEEMFVSAAEAQLHVMVEAPDRVRPRVTRSLELVDPSVEMLLFRFLQEFLFEKDAHGLLLRPVEVRLTEGKFGWRLRAALAGEPLDPTRHRPGADVKAVTLHRFQVRRRAGGWESFVVLDI